MCNTNKVAYLALLGHGKLVGRKQAATVSMADLPEEQGISGAFRICGGRRGSAVEGPAVAN
jgi:hypothetical protein